MSKFRLLKFIIPMTISLLVLQSCGGGETNTNTEQDPVPVETALARSTEFPRNYRYTGSVEGEHRITLSTKLTGRITRLEVENGDPVERGQVLIRIKNDNILAQQEQVEANLSQAMAGLKNTKTNYERIKALYADSSATQKELDDIETRLRVAESSVQALKSKLAEIEDLMDYAVIESPINGYVVEKQKQVGDLASPGRPILTVEEVNDLKVTVTVPESQILFFSAGDTVNVSVEAAGARFPGTVTSVNQSGEAMSRQFEVKVAIPQSIASNGNIKPGMFSEVVLRRGTVQLLTVPKKALVERGQLTGLFAVNDRDELLLRWVRTGRTRGDNVEIISGLREGERYVLAGDRNLREGQVITTQ